MKFTLPVLSFCFLVISACGGHSHNDKDKGTQQEQPAPTDGNGSFTKICRLAKEVEGGNFQFQWSDQSTADRLQFDTTKNRVRVASTGNTSVSGAATYTVKLPPANEVGILGSINYDGFSLSFPVIPTGSIEGESGTYLIGNLTRGNQEIGTFLCTPSLANEFQ